ncbi:MAG: site-specific DNA-methyltransferase [Deltaproteobacteria bacterium]|nr:site-specific DNA-methyltransferase [Deltaproteobacteria bacterium]
MKAHGPDDGKDISVRLYTPVEILGLFRSKPVDTDWSFSWCTPKDTSKLTHGYHRYPAKFIPQLVERLMDEYLTGRDDPHVNDPFMGSGTTVACAISRGYKASGTDINHVSGLITRVKGTPIDPEYLQKRVKAFLSDLSLGGPRPNSLSSYPSIRPYIPEINIERIDYWFKPEIKQELGTILAKIREETDIDIRNFLKVCFSHVLKTVSLWLMGSTKPARDTNKNPPKPMTAFQRHLEKMVRGNRAFWDVVPAKVKPDIGAFLNIKRGDAREQPVEGATVDIQITSSPYVTSYEYADLHQLSTLWFEYAPDLSGYREGFIGTSYKHYEDSRLKSKIAESIAHQMKNKDQRMAKGIEAFFIDMQECFDETYRILKHGGRCCYVIGNTALKKVDILNAEVFAESMQCSGLAIERVIKREIPLKTLPQKRDAGTGRFAKGGEEDFSAYPTEYIVIGKKV